MGVRIGAVQRAGVVERLGRLIPRSGALQTDCQIEPARGIAGLQARQGAIAFGCRVEPPQFELDMAQRPPNFGRGLITGDGPLQQIEGLFALSRQVERHSAAQDSGLARARLLGARPVIQFKRLHGLTHNSLRSRPIYVALSAASQSRRAVASGADENPISTNASRPSLGAPWQSCRNAKGRWPR